LLLEKPMQTRPTEAASAVSEVAIGAARIIDATSGGLLRIQSKLGVGLSRLGTAGNESCDKADTQQYCKQLSRATMVQRFYPE
jgi:hypothetical protein